MLTKLEQQLFDALAELKEQTVDSDVDYGIGLTEGEKLAKTKAEKAIAHGLSSLRDKTRIPIFQ